MAATTPVAVMPDMDPVDLADLVRESLRIRPGDDAGLELAARAVVAQVDRWHGNDWTADVQTGAVLLTARIWRRRQSPGGVEQFGGDQVAYVSRTDPDVAQLLGLGRWQPPAVG